ncbi:hypothetical protein [Pseudomonas chlororaphis]|uniref:Uncharacterized protein n=1 Tax=Pseudomonas chlororaphis TaxID=587753 RepID=A0AAX3G8H3_9PSED|nr:hypothetical protein [Pseudomonas chlororaphis]AZC37101.1 hypothetical protein C4K37_2714 [Pseudomonas chlororaphis subsp. piscium]AZC43647.1 hypothetical protein C4K36_2722 [Pseudomonas chlororaphis subsp. piscium]WDG74373.1 hypothetical protein PUP65_08435 [Pseudomonas chlororaphis]WDG75511.1 hypothetical protein PUP65_14400 [Pseudomonas chlororaphis]WDH26853.1 hypothetical protein PUP81_19910 [Pseudomonas chlororaphis]
MAAKTEYVVVDGCLQDGAKVIRQGEVYDPPSKEVAALLVAEGKIARRGQLPKDDQDD